VRRVLYTRDSRFEIAQGKTITQTGYALVWNVLSDDRGGYKVRLLPGSAKFTTPTLALYQHDFRDVIGNTENGTLRLTPDDYGVKVEIDLPDTTTGRDVAELVSKGYVRGMSFSMVSAPKGETSRENGETILNAEAFEVDEVTVTAIPSFSSTSVEIKPAPAYARISHALELERLRLSAVRLDR
jgi:HK97 family phage prohead protease